MRAVGRRGLPGPADSVLAGVVTSFAVLDVAVLRLTPEFSARPLAALPFAVLIPGCLAARRRRPVLGALVAAALTAVQAVAVAPTNSLAQVVTLLVLAYSLGAHASVRAGLIGLSACLAAVFLLAVRSSDSVGGELSIVPFMAVPFLAGGAVRSARGYGQRLERLTAQLEAERERGARLAVAEERAAIARELHDVVSHGVGVMALQAGGARRIIDQDPSRARDALAAIESSGRAALVELQRMVTVLRAPGDETGQGASDAAGGAARSAGTPSLDELPGLVERLRSGGVDVRMHSTGVQPPLPPVFDLAVFRILQEAMTNATRHAPGATVLLELRWAVGAVTLVVRNTAAACAPHSPSGGHGLIGMRERVRLFGGDLDTGPSPDGGFRVQAFLPLPELT